jgi:hypothetical protein
MKLARFRRWFTAFEAGRADHAKELESTATKLGRLAGRPKAALGRRSSRSKCRNANLQPSVSKRTH